MQLVGVCGPDDDRAAVANRLAERLGEEGRVATVERAAVRASTEAGDAAFVLGDDGRWTAAGTSRTLDDVVDDVAPDYDYLVLSGFPDADAPQVAVGDAEGVEDPAVQAPTADAVDLDAVVDAVDRTEPYETLESLVAEVKRSPRAERSGAIATFTGRVRARDADDDAPTEFLEFEKYEGVAERKLATICEELEARDGVFDVVMHHRTGVIPYGDDIVFVVVLAGHRDEAFRTVEDGINRLKDEVPIFKREVTVEEEFWVHER